MKSVIKFIVLLGFFTNPSYAKNTCTTPNRKSGQCISLCECEPLLALARNRNRSPAEEQLIYDSLCGWTYGKHLVCCPKPETTNDTICYTPDGREGNCVGLSSCPHLTKLLEPPAPGASIDYVRNSRCEGPDQYSVCCGPDVRWKQPRPSRVCAPTTAPPNPSTECCGRENLIRYKIAGGHTTSIDQYPWLAIIEYEPVRVRTPSCGGALISGRYVLTAAHCVAGKILEIRRPINVRLGEYNTTHSGPDCVDTEGGGFDCTDGAQIIPIEKITPHSQYEPNSIQRHDIALVRLREVAVYSDFIRPICLPTFDITQDGRDGIRLHVAGWDETKSRFSSDVKLHADVTLISLQECQQTYKSQVRNAHLSNSQICARGENSEGSCRGDSGGPLMYYDGSLQYVVGVFNFGVNHFFIIDNIPGVYTNVYEYLPWIRSNIKP